MSLAVTPESCEASTSSTSPELSPKNLQNEKVSVKFCRVCGDKALGYNFNVVSCESCKAFFRRNALKSKDFRCPFSNSCDVSVVSRRFCQKCRLRKCFEVGMKKEWIMSDEARSQKRRRIEENRERRKFGSFSDNTGSPSKRVGSCELSDSVSQDNQSMDDYCSPIGASVRSSAVSPQFNQHYFPSEQPAKCQTQTDDCISIPKSVLINLLSSSSGNAGSQSASTYSSSHKQSTAEKNWGWIPKQCVCRCTCGAKPPESPIGQTKCDKSVLTDPEIYFDPVLMQQPTVQQISYTNLPTDIFPYSCDRQSQQFMNVEDSVYKVLNAAISSAFADGVNLSLESVEQSERFSGLTEFEQQKLDELIAANEVMNEPMEKFLGDQKKENPSITDVINLTDIAIRRIIKMSKRIDCFKNLCQEDQIALLKGGCTELMILRGVMTYDPEKDSWHGPSSHYIKLEVLKGVKGNVYEEHKRYLQSFSSGWRTNEPIMLILCAITLFTPSRPNVTHKEIIKSEQEMYYGMLKRYLLSNYGGSDGKVAFDRLVENIEKLHRLNDNAVRIFLDLNPKDVEPLLLEIFDLK